MKKDNRFKESSLQSDTVKNNLRRLSHNLNSPFIDPHTRKEIVNQLIKTTFGSDYEVIRK